MELRRVAALALHGGGAGRGAALGRGGQHPAAAGPAAPGRGAAVHLAAARAAAGAEAGGGLLRQPRREEPRLLCRVELEQDGLGLVSVKCQVCCAMHLYDYVM